MAKSGHTTKTRATLPQGLQDMLIGPQGGRGTGGILPGILGGHGSPGKGQGEVGAYDPTARAGAFDRLFVNPGRFQDIGNTLGETMSGANLDASKTEVGQNLIKAITDQSNVALGQNVADMRSRFAQAGHNLSGPLMQAETQAITRTAQGRDAAIADALFNTYNQERGRQLGATSALQAYEQTPFDIFNQLAGLFQQEKSTGPRPNPTAAVLGK